MRTNKSQALVEKMTTQNWIALTLTLSLVILQLANFVTTIESPKPARSSTNDRPQNELCLKRATELDRCLPRLVVYGDRNFAPPRDDKQLDEHCSSLDENLKCIGSYSRECLPAFAKNLYSVVVRRLKVQFAKRCKSKDGRRDFLNLMACAEPKTMEPLHKCMDIFIAHLEHIGKGNQNRQIELTCCTFQLFTDCIYSATRQSRCTQRRVPVEKSIEYVRTIISSMGGDMMDFMCGKYDNLQACRQGYPDMMGQFSSLGDKVRNNTVRPVSGSPLKPMLQLFIDQQAQLED